MEDFKEKSGLLEAVIQGGAVIMANEEKLAFRILASLYPDSKPSEIRKIINDALEKQVCSDDVSLWMALTKETGESQKKEVEVIEHHYHHYHPWWSNGNISLTGTNYEPDPITTDKITITCEGNRGNDSISCTDYYTSSSVTTAWN